MSPIKIYTQLQHGQAWIERVRGLRPGLVLTLGFTETGLVEGISAAGATPRDRRYTALADAEFMVNGLTPVPKFPLPPLQAGASPALISRAVIAEQGIPLVVLNAGLPQPPAVPHVDLGGKPAQCLSTGAALPLEVVHHLWRQGLAQGEFLGDESDYLLLAECVVGGTTTALGLLTGLRVDATERVNSSHPTCNHGQKQALVAEGLSRAGLLDRSHPLAVVAAVGDPMQPMVAGLAIAASRARPVLLAGGTQMLAVYALMVAMAAAEGCDWNPQNVVVGTTRWVAEDATGDTVGLAELTGACLMAMQLSFAESRFEALRAYEQGFVKEGVGAGGCAIAASLYQNWGQPQLLAAVEALLEQKSQLEQL
ncbi:MULTISPECIES: nicotinate mononucleotide-dependent phosphoribosyltransferase CobT [Cyanophyceae]|uniref:nicotinate mononucleotide-dependent phosphoribosyltransferase CobT n=1 Tax=Cyanophyceae TaxID=3028117 RepID=UPI0016840495|nr:MULTISPECIES: TIGR00303 family protein [Cyanophyceae]MBD1919187.1 TIGR00303 family protein [Phormidium sp. FACHB-77]MBD2033168.1 TIGR00303 family protein [Phormidium sp. FACHB-322]MBD2054134.1 TIGR00303 family protein [Leptolyngbya sp. FACHB-60]